MDDLISEFIAESRENLTRIDRELVDLERTGGDPELIASIFRSIHTIKGTCGFFGLERVLSLAHSTENVFGRMREGTLSVEPSCITLTLEAIDRIREMLTAVEQTGCEPEIDTSELVRQLDAFTAFDSSSAGSDPALSDPALSDVESDSVSSVAPPPNIPPTAPRGFEPADTASSAMASPKSGMRMEAAVAEAQPEAVVAVVEKPADDLSIRVQIDVIDRLMNLVGELVLTRNQLLQLARGDEESKYATPITHLNRVTIDLQEAVMKTRMQPIGNAWAHLPRLLRDLTQAIGKQIDLNMLGAETELDRTVLDAIKDPLTHIVRNSADHGIEMPEARRQLGKPEAGQLRLNAFHEGGHVIITVEDDGAGVNVERVRARAIANGLVTEVDAARLSPQEIIQFIFLPGFSTAEKVTSVSGRGVGMDVVRTQIEKIGGTVDLQSVPGAGTSIRARIPLTLAIISALVVESGGELFAIPQLGVVELVRLAAEDRHRIESIHSHQVFRLRNRLLPLIRLDDVLGLTPTRPEHEFDVNIVVVQVGDEQFGLIVDGVFDTQEIVVKPVGSLLKEIPIYQGTTILGDGRVIMILDVTGIATESGSLSAASEAETGETSRDSEGDRTSVLLFGTGGNQVMSVPLSLVARLEEFPVDRIERTGDRLVIQYRGDLLPLLPVEGAASQMDERGIQPVVVFSEYEHSMGLMVDRIEDVLEEELLIRMSSRRPGVLGTAIIDNRAIDILDAHYYLMQANPKWYEQQNSETTIRVLLAEDSVFFRQLATTALESAGCSVSAVTNGRQASELLERDASFDIVISDIEMPEMDGLQLASWIRSRPQWAGLPLIGLSGNVSADMAGRAGQSGFNRFLRKFDPTELTALVKQLCSESRRLQGASA